MIRLIFLAVLVWAVYVIVKRLITTPPSSSNAPTEDIVQCAFCGLYSPKSESYSISAQPVTDEQNTSYFCCKDHSDQYKKSHN